MNESVNISHYSIVTKCIAIMLVIALMVNITLSANAAEASVEYVEDVFIVTAADKDEAQSNANIAAANENKGKTYTVYENPIYDSSSTKTWLCYSTTTDKNLAITSIKAMNMNGGWSYSEYDEYLNDLWSNADMLVDDMLKAIREYNANLAAGSEKAAYAKTVLDMIWEDDTKQSVADFFAEAPDPKLATDADQKKYRDQLTVLVMEANTDNLCSIQNALMIGCIDSRNDILEKMGLNYFKIGINGYRDKSYDEYYSSYAQDIINSLPAAQEAIAFYESEDGYPYTDEMEELTQMIEKEIIVTAKDEGKTKEKILEERDEAFEKMLQMAADEDNNPLGLTEDQIYTAQALVEQRDYYFNDLTSEQKVLYNNGRVLYNTLYGCKYGGYFIDDNNNRQYSSLLGLIMKYDLNSTQKLDETYEKSDFYPLLSLMTDGQRAMLKVGFTQFITALVTPAAMLEMNKTMMLDSLNKTAESGAEIEEGATVSAYLGVDRTLFQKGSGIAMTSKAIEAQYSKPIDENTNYYKKMEKVATYVLIASGATFAVTTATTLGLAGYMKTVFTTAAKVNSAFPSQSFLGVFMDIKTTIMPSAPGLPQSKVIFTQTLSKGAPFGAEPAPVLVELGEAPAQGFTGTFKDCLNAFIRAGGIGTVLTVVNLIAIAAMIISLIVMLVAQQKAFGADAPYIDIPRVICSYQPIYDSDKEEYIYYYGVRNPLLTQDDQKRASAIKDENGNSTNILKYGIGDIANWTLKGKNREWVALYTSTDKRAGRPILANSFIVTSESLEIGTTGTQGEGHVAIRKFNHNEPYDMHEFYGVTTLWSVGERYIGYMMESDSTLPTSASVFSGASPIGMLAVGTLAGGSIGALITYFVSKKRRNRMRAAEG